MKLTESAETKPYRIELGVYDPQGDSPMRCEDFLRGHDSGEIAWFPNLEDSVLFLEADGREWLSNEWNLGNLQLVVSQLEDIQRRLEVGETAILRSAVLEQPYAPYFLFQPVGKDDPSGFIHISQFFILDPAFGKLFPIEYWSASDPRRLFEYVKVNRTRLLADDPWYVPGKMRLTGLPFPRAELLGALPVQAALGSRILDLARRRK